MGETYSLCLLGIMDRLWFHQIILFSEPINTALYATKILNQHQPTSDTSNPSLLPLQDTQTHHQSTKQENPILKPSSITSLENTMKNDEDVKERSTRKDNPVRPRARSHSSSPMTQKRPRKHYLKQQVKSLQKSSSCRSFEDLEMEEVKGFMDLGFVFKKSNLSPKLISVVPGLQRLGIYHENKQSTRDGTIHYNLVSSSSTSNSTSSSFTDGEEEETKTSVIMRPYLSEAWLIKRPDSPLLNLRVPRVSASADMKKHLRFWARTVASEIQYESWEERRFGLLSC